MMDTGTFKIIEDHLDDEKGSLKKQRLDLSNKIISDYSFQQIKEGSEKRPRWYLLNPVFEKAIFKDCSFNTIRFERGNFKNVTFENVTFETCFFIDCEFNDSLFNQVEFKNRVCINGCDLTGTQFVNCNLTCDGSDFSFENSRFKQSKFSCLGSKANFKKFQVIDSELTFIKNSAHTDKDKFDFSGSKINSSKIVDSIVPPSSNFDSADLSGSEIVKSSFIKCNFNNTRLFGIVLGNEVVINSTDFNGAEIDRYSLECITKDQLPNSSRVKMVIRDDIAKLRLIYSGAYRFINFFLLLAFAAPYCWFVGKLWLVAKFQPSEDVVTISMLGALGRYIVSGGQHWESEWIINFFPMILFFIAIFYNCSRLILLLKTISLEHQEKVKGLPIDFNIRKQPWFFLYKANYMLFFINFLVVIFHSYYFLLQRVPTGSG